MTLITESKQHDAFKCDGEIHVVFHDASVWSGDLKPALDSGDFKNLLLVNHGGIFGDGGGVGLRFTAHSTGSIINVAGGAIGGSNGVEIHSTGVSFTNWAGQVDWSGGVYGHNAAVYLGLTSHNNIIVNHGLIDGDSTGVRDSSSHGGNTIINDGTIFGGDFGISYWTKPGLVTHVVNSGTIEGLDFAITTGNTGSLDLANTGEVRGDIVLASTSALDADTIANQGVIFGLVELGAGNDAFSGAGGENVVDPRSGHVGIFGEAGDDLLVGGKTNDALFGGIGNDKLAGGFGDDTLIGGGNADHFVFDTALASAGVDRIVDFQQIDTIDLAHSIFTATNAAGTLNAGMFFKGAAAHDANDRVIYDPSTGELTYDSNGKAAGGAHHIATLEAHLALTNADFLIV